MNFECEDAKFKLKHAYKQLKHANIEKDEAIECASRIQAKDQEVPLNIKMIGKLRKKVQTLEISLNKERKTSSLLNSLSSLS